MTRRHYAEDAQMRAYFEWAGLYSVKVTRPHGVLYIPLVELAFHIPNERANRTERMRLAALGVLPGVADICVPVPRGGWHGLWIELKTGKRPATDAQLRFIRRMCALGYAANVCHGWDQAREVTRSYLGDSLCLYRN